MDLRIYRDNIIDGQSIYLKTLKLKNATQEYCNWLNDSEVNRYLETRSATVSDLKKYIKEKTKNKNCLLFGIFFKKNNKHIGNLKLELFERDKKIIDFGILIGDKNYWGKGIATEATKMAVDFVFNQLNFDEVELGVAAENSAALKVYEKVGFKVKKYKKKAFNYSGRFYDYIIMVIKRHGL